jgi:nucleotide-binding universal stress UspA family protein
MKNLFERILVPFDFSPQSRRALAAACDLAATHRGEVAVLCALEPINSLAGIRPPGGPIWFPSDEVVAAEQRRLQKAVDSVRAGRLLVVRSSVVVAAPLEAILAAAKNADVIVMATTGRGVLSHLLVGSVAEKVVRHAPVPVLTMGPGARKRTARGGQRRRKRAA